MKLSRRSSSLPLFMRAFDGRAYAFLLIALAVLLLAVNLLFPQIVQGLRAAFTDMTAPVVRLVAQPGQGLFNLGKSWEEWTHLYSENKALQQQVAELKSWRVLAEQYAQENKALRGLLKYKDESVAETLAVRVIAQAGGNFSNSIIVTAGRHDNVRKDMIAMSEDGVVGRVIEVGEWSSRVLLLTDINSRLPVALETGERAILAGQGADGVKMLYLSRDVQPKIGARILTSGHGGIFPPNLPVGVITGLENGLVRVTPFARFDRMQLLRLVVYQLAGGEQNPMNQGASVPEAGHAAPAGAAP